MDQEFFPDIRLVSIGNRPLSTTYFGVLATVIGCHHYSRCLWSCSYLTTKLLSHGLAMARHCVGLRNIMVFCNIGTLLFFIILNGLYNGVYLIYDFYHDTSSNNYPHFYSVFLHVVG